MSTPHFVSSIAASVLLLFGNDSSLGKTNQLPQLIIETGIEYNAAGRVGALLLIAQQQHINRVASEAANEFCWPTQTMDQLKLQLAYERSTNDFPLLGIPKARLKVWTNQNQTLFYIVNHLQGFREDLRLVYAFDNGKMRGRATCPSSKDWRACVAELAGSTAGANPRHEQVQTCETTLDVSSIPQWQPSAMSSKKMVILQALRRQAESKYADLKRVVIRDFNLNDNQILMYIQTSGAEYYQACSLDSNQAPFCDHWHLFGQAPVKAIRRLIFSNPLDLKASRSTENVQ